MNSRVSLRTIVLLLLALALTGAACGVDTLPGAETQAGPSPASEEPSTEEPAAVADPTAEPDTEVPTAATVEDPQPDQDDQGLEDAAPDDPGVEDASRGQEVSGGVDAPDARPAPCELVSDEALAALVEGEVVDAQERPVAELIACRYTTAAGGSVQIISVDAASWAGQLPPALETIERSGLFDDEASQEKLAEAHRLIDLGWADDASKACVLFSVLLEIQGLDAGQTEIVNFVPDSTTPLAVNGQRCTDGWYSSVQWQASGLADDGAVSQRVTATLGLVHRAALA